LTSVLKLKNKELKQKISDLESIIQKNVTLIDCIPDLFILLDTNIKILFLNEAMAKSLGEKKENLIGKNALDYFPPEVAKYRTKMANKLIKTKKPFTFEDKRDGRWFKQSLFPVLDSEGNVIQIANMVEEITEQKEMKLSLDEKENKLEEIDQKYQILTDNMADMVFQLKLSGKFTYVNPSSKRYGYNPDELVGKSFTKFVPKRELPRYFAQIKKMVSGEKIDSFESHVIHKDGSILPAEFSGQMIKIGKKRYINGILRNTADRVKAEGERRKLDERYKMLLENFGCPITYVNTNGKILLINELGAKNLKGTPDDFIGKSIYEIIPDFAEENKMRFLKIEKSGIGDIYEDLFKLPNGNQWFISNLQPVKENNNKIVGIQIVSIDITKQKEIEREVKDTKNYLQNVIDSASEIIFTIGSDLKIKTWNKSARMITGYKKSHVVGKSINNLTLFENQSEINDYIKTILNGKTASLEELTINTSFGIKKQFSVSPSFMRDESKNVNEVLFVCRDITYEKERHGKLQFGQSYLISESTSEAAVEIFAGMLRSGHPGLYIGRTSDSKIKNIFTDVTPTIVKLSKEKDKKHLTCSNFEELLRTIKDYVSKEKQSIVLLDRIEYLIINSSFESVIKNIYLLNDMIGKHNCLLLLRISPSLLDKTQMVILKEELQQLPERKIDDIQLEESLFDILDYIQIENKRNAILSYSRIGKQFSISKVTTQRRIESLLEKGLVFTKKQGRIKTIYITDKGKNLLAQRTII
jgi:PAS domain S-box-containing protein